MYLLGSHLVTVKLEQTAELAAGEYGNSRFNILHIPSRLFGTMLGCVVARKTDTVPEAYARLHDSISTRKKSELPNTDPWTKEEVPMSRCADHMPLYDTCSLGFGAEKDPCRAVGGTVSRPVVQGRRRPAEDPTRGEDTSAVQAPHRAAEEGRVRRGQRTRVLGSARGVAPTALVSG